MQRLVWFVVCITLLGCGRDASADPVMHMQTVDGITIVLESQPNPVMAMPQTWTVRLTDTAGTPMNDAEVYLDLVMPGMPMGQQKPIATPAGSGRYVASGVYTMDETWQVVVHVAVAGVKYQATFPITVQPQPADPPRSRE